VIVFLDASALIYRLEGEPRLAAAVNQRLTRLAANDAGLRIAVSRLTWLECRVAPLRRGDSAVLAQYDAFFGHPDLIWSELTRNVVELATAIRAHHGLRTPDALQAACCLQLGPGHVLLTGDRAYSKLRELRVELID
jgi:predicted nucleic acid-binding protein